MIAEIYHKSVDIGSEDQLTGNVFGGLRYMPYPLARQIIINSILPISASKLLDESLTQEISGEWGRNVYFWKHYMNSQTEPDIVMELEQVVILIEVKYNSSLSGNDQLIREAELLTKNYSEKKKFLILLAREDSAISIYNNNKLNITPEVFFGYCTWQRLFDNISTQKVNSLICNDLTNYLYEKGFAGFRGFDMMNEEIIKAFTLVRDAHKSVQEFISRCILLAEEKGEFEIAPMTGSNTFLRWSSDKNANAWSYTDFIIIFQQCSDAKLQNGYRDGALYILEINFDSDWFVIPTANIARYDYDNIAKNWTSGPISPSDHWIFYDPMYYGVIEYSEYESGKMYYGEADEPLARYWGLKRVMGYEIPLVEITSENAYHKIFGTFKELAKKK